MNTDSKITINDLPADVVEQMRNGIREDPQMQTLLQKKIKLYELEII